MYNPVNMQVEDENRLMEKDLREKNKKQRYEVRYDAETITRKECLAEQDRLDAMALNKVSFMRDREQLQRGFDILTNDHLSGGLAKRDATQFMQKPQPIWKRLESATAKEEEPIPKGLMD
jgi:hypothetical protein